MNIPPQIAMLIHRDWGISPVPDHWFFTDDYGGRIAMSIRAPKGTHRGWVLRQRRGQNKALTFVNDGEVSLSWYKEQPFAPTVIVEDIPSAIRASTYVNSVALLGTGIGTAQATEIAAYGSGNIVLALDQDATALSFKWARKYSLLWGDVKVLPLKKDLKNMTEDALKELLSE